MSFSGKKGPSLSQVWDDGAVKEIADGDQLDVIVTCVERTAIRGRMGDDDFLDRGASPSKHVGSCHRQSSSS